MSAGADHAVAVCRDMITKGSKSFSLASRIFSAGTRDMAFSLYGWCRYCDDQIDGSELGFPSPLAGEGQGEGTLRSDGPLPNPPPQGGRESALERLRRLTADAYDGKPMTDPVFQAFQRVVRQARIPREYPLELLEGMAMDVRGDRYETLSDLRLYCYRVAGTVGLMMSHVMGLSDENALRNAADMGIAMQLTNIARDVREDAEMGRVYLPLAWLRASAVPPEKVLAPEHRDAVVKIVARLLDEAEALYRSGDRGLKHLDFRAACAVGAARRVYAEIGRRVRKRGAKAWDTRTVVPAGRKIFVMASGLARVGASIPRRALRPWRSAPIRTIWRHS